MLCVPVVYVIGRLGWGPIAGAIAAWLLAVSHLHIHYSRLGQGFMVATLLAALTMMCLALAAVRAQARPLREPGTTWLRGRAAGDRFLDVHDRWPGRWPACRSTSTTRRGSSR